MPTLSTLVTAVVAGNLTTLLSGRGNGAGFTVFAPNNDAFSKLSPSALRSLLNRANIKELDEVLSLHVIPGSIRVRDLKDAQKITTLTGQQLTFEVTGAASDPKVFVFSKGTTASAVVAADNNATNGVVHIVDKVLLPQ